MQQEKISMNTVKPSIRDWRRKQLAMRKRAQEIIHRSKGDIGATEKIYKFKEKLKEKIAPAIEVKPGD